MLRFERIVCGSQCVPQVCDPSIILAVYSFLAVLRIRTIRCEL
ncbi:hypothetical protein AQ1_02535 [alpha proteobacterium Q-1]|nr:hypothetical protein AQ1_02535 [alpha proteobacterium Q-1]